MWVMEEKAISNIMSIFECNLTNFLCCIGNVYPFEETVLEGPGSSSRELAQWGYTSPSEEQIEIWSAPFIPVSNKAASGTKEPTLFHSCKDAWSRPV